MKRRKKEFKAGNPKALTVKDSRFGLRRMFLNPNEKPSVWTYENPGKGVNGEHQN
jgi:hypothetical protein